MTQENTCLQIQYLRLCLIDIAIVEAEVIGETAALCTANSLFQLAYNECQACVQANSVDHKNTTVNTQIQGLEPFLSYCGEAGDLSILTAALAAESSSAAALSSSQAALESSIASVDRSLGITPSTSFSTKSR